MNRIETAKLLHRLGKHKVGLNEAAVLFCIDGDTTYDEIAKVTNLDKRTMWSRMAVLKAKGYVHTKFSTTGTALHYLTAKGKKLITSVLTA